ncbi:MAG: hypothetical protein HUJ98_15270 [Bacteroidaceae bacterium]|nr:hypothetical protein [Bacteroidaceae bacterium]
MFVLQGVLGAETALGLGKVLSLVYFSAVVIIFLLHETNWKTLTLLFSLMVIFVCPSHSYTYVYFSACLLAFFYETGKEEFSAMNMLCAVLWSMVYTAWPIGNFRPYLTIAAVYAVVLICFVDSVKDIVLKMVSARGK